MLSIFKQLLKRNRCEINISEAIYSDKHIYCFGDLYEKLGINKFIEEMKAKNTFNKYHIDNIRCNSITYNKLMEMFKYNLIKTKNKYSKTYKEPKLRTMIAFDSLAFGPAIREEVKTNYIKVILPGDKEYRTVIKEDISI